MTSDNADAEIKESTKITRFNFDYAKNVDQMEIVFESGEPGQINLLEIEPFSLSKPELDFLPKTMKTKMNDIETEVFLTMDQD